MSGRAVTTRLFRERKSYVDFSERGTGWLVGQRITIQTVRGASPQRGNKCLSAPQLSKQVWVSVGFSCQPAHDSYVA